MKVLISLNHPAHYHLFKNYANQVIENKGKVVFFIQPRDIIEELVKNGGFEYRFSTSRSLRAILNGKYGVILRSIISILQQEASIFWYNLTHKVDFMLGSDIAIAHVGFLFRRKAIIFTDDDYCFTKPYAHIAYPYAAYIFAPFAVDISKWKYKKIGYHGTQKSAYLHPKYFIPVKSVLEKYGLDGKRFFIIRLVSFKALHDILHDSVSGFNREALDAIILLLKEHGEIIISSEGEIESKYANYNKKIEPPDMLHLMYFADLMIGDSQSMTVEAALLGTPTIRSNKWVIAKEKVNVIEYLERNYEMCYSIDPNSSREIISKVSELLSDIDKNKLLWIQKRQRFFMENTNLTDFLYWFTSNYPSNSIKYKKNPTIINEFSKT
jgi:predicted glycosyltransferase